MGVTRKDGEQARSQRSIRLERPGLGKPGVLGSPARLDL